MGRIVSRDLSNSAKNGSGVIRDTVAFCSEVANIKGTGRCVRRLYYRGDECHCRDDDMNEVQSLGLQKLMNIYYR